MTWFGDLVRLRVNLAIVLVGAACVIGMVKLTSLLPEQFYFRFSGLVKSDSSPFIVQPPGVTYARLCEIVRKNSIEDKTFAAGLDCAFVSAQASSAPSYGQQNAEAIYRLAYAADPQIRATVTEAIRQLPVQPAADADVQQEAQYASNLGTFLNGIERRYTMQVRQQLKPYIERTFADRFADLPDRQETSRPPPQGQQGLAAEAVQLVSTAHATIAADITRPFPNLQLEPISKAKLDEIVSYGYSREGVVSSIADYYVEQVAEAYAERMRARLAGAGLDAKGDAVALDQAMLSEGAASYGIAAAIRIAPVLLFGLLIGGFFGYREVDSAATAAGLAAFLLAWPVILLWETVVSSSWQDQQPLFIGFYIVYVLAFFLTARLGALIGTAIRKAVRGTEAGDGVMAAPSGLALRIGRDVALALVTNALFYIGNAMMVLVA